MDGGFWISRFCDISLKLLSTKYVLRFLTSCDYSRHFSVTSGLSSVFVGPPSGGDIAGGPGSSLRTALIREGEMIDLCSCFVQGYELMIFQP